LGVAPPPRFLRWPDGTVPNADHPDARALIAAILENIPVDENVAVLAPWRRDPHVDHRAVASLVAAAMRERPRGSLIEYAVWLGVRGDVDGDAPRPDEGRIVEVESGPWLPAKRAALQEHRSQLGGVISDAAGSFELPAELLARALGPVERFVIAAVAGVRGSK
jgi:LmbE family N-acetylglucosaminyl deacetylase